MKIVLLNDTSNNEHYGCFAVMNALRRYLNRRRDVSILPIFNRQLRADPGGRIGPQQSRWLRTVFSRSDLIIVNGEGTLHSNRAPEIEGALTLAYDSGVPYFVVNSIFMDYPGFAEFLRRAEGVSLRDARSVDEARTLGIEVTRCQDAALYAAFDAFEHVPESGESCVTDFHPEAPTTTRLEFKRALASGARYLPFQSGNGWRTWPGLVARIATFGHVVSGRYHGALLAALAGRPCRMLPSNSGKIGQLATELGFEREDDSQDSTFVLSKSRAREAQQRLLEMRRSQTLHPLSIVDLQKDRPHRRGSFFSDGWNGGAVFAGREPGESERARLTADFVSSFFDPISKGSGRSLRTMLSEHPDATLERVSKLLIQEQRYSQCRHLISALQAVGENEQARELAIELLNRQPASHDALVNLAVAQYQVSNDAMSAAVFDVADTIHPLSQRQCQIAARASVRLREFDAQLRYFERASDGALTSELEPALALEIASAANRANEMQKAAEYAQSALFKAAKLDGEHHMQAAVILAANGDFAGGCRAMNDALRRVDTVFATQRTRSASAIAALYVPGRIGVGSAILALRWLSDRASTQPTATIGVEKRLHCVFRRKLGDRVELTTPDQLDLTQSTGFNSIFELIAEHEPTPEPSATADPTRVQIISTRYRSRFGDRPRVGVVWSTPNTRTGSGRNLSLAAVRELIVSRPELQFVALQPNIAQAVRDSRQIAAPNLWIDTAIDPIASLEDSFAQIAALDAVIGIDCSVLHFAGALGVRGTVLLTGEPTWQWPQRKSLWGSIAVVTDKQSLPSALARMIP